MMTWWRHQNYHECHHDLKNLGSTTAEPRWSTVNSFSSCSSSASSGCANNHRGWGGFGNITKVTLPLDHRVIISFISARRVSSWTAPIIILVIIAIIIIFFVIITIIIIFWPQQRGSSGAQWPAPVFIIVIMVIIVITIIINIIGIIVIITIIFIFLTSARGISWCTLT